MNFEFRALVLKKFRRQADAAPVMGIRENRLSQIICGRVKPRPDELEKFRSVLGNEVDAAFPRPKQGQQRARAAGQK